ncbi:uncharacterized protein [Diadema setosum]|uniref:uncharacterized protein n=1 Tax=Diadema setosum TaxID=31175 RepID=UPI003B3A317E
MVLTYSVLHNQGQNSGPCLPMTTPSCQPSTHQEHVDKKELFTSDVIHESDSSQEVNAHVAVLEVDDVAAASDGRKEYENDEVEVASSCTSVAVLVTEVEEENKAEAEEKGKDEVGKVFVAEEEGEEEEKNEEEDDYCDIKDILRVCPLRVLGRHRELAAGGSILEVELALLHGAPSLIAIEDEFGEMSVPMEMRCNQASVKIIRKMIKERSQEVAKRLSNNPPWRRRCQISSRRKSSLNRLQSLRKRHGMNERDDDSDSDDESDMGRSHKKRQRRQ